jgi:predicted ATPase
MTDTAGQFFVITGGPGSGKSTLIDALQARGFARSMEAGRGVIQDQVAIGGRALPWSDPVAFSELILSWELRSYRMAQDYPGLVFFDRGIPDVAGYLRLLNRRVPDHVDKAPKLFGITAAFSLLRLGKKSLSKIRNANRISPRRCEPVRR